MTSCVKEKFETEAPTPTPGSEVKFTADLGTTLTKTMYGDEVDTDSDGTNDAVKVHWVDEDLISVYGTTCSVKQAEYSVIGATSDDGYSYAASLTKTGAAGVQWGSEATSNFIAVYPSTAGTITHNDDGSVTIPTSIGATQYNVFTKNSEGVWQGAGFDHEKNSKSMPNAVMYAYTSDAINGETVNLRFKPFSTVLKFQVNTWTTNTENPELPTDPTGTMIQVKSIKLTAPEAVAGDFNMTVTSSGVSNVAVVGTGSNTITLEPQAPINWLYGQALEFSIFAIPKSGLSLSENWKVTISTSDGDKVFSLKPKTGANSTLLAGKIHKVNVKNGFQINSVWTYKTSEWMKSIPRNVYIADLSLPGSWYACDSGYQDGTLEEQYAAGIRAFNIDCRLTLAEGKSVKTYGKAIDSGFRTDYEYIDNEAHITDGTLVLACSGTETRDIASYSINSIGMKVKDALCKLGELAVTNPEEYVEVIITCSQKPKQENATGSQLTMGTVNAKMMNTAITNVLNDPEVTPYLYTDIITPNTTLGNVKGKIVVKVNMNTDNSNLVTWNISAPALFSEGTMAESADAGRYIKKANFTSMNSPAMYWSNTFTPTVGNEMVFHYHQAQNTTGSDGFPSVDDRKYAIESIVTQSYAEYSSNGHNGWYQIGIGGWTTDNDSGKAALSQELNPYLLGIINEMLAGTRNPAPVGAVLMNLTTTESKTLGGIMGIGSTTYTLKSAELIKAIIDLNGAYFLNRDDSQPAWPDAVDAQAAPASNGAYALVGEDAF